MPGPIIKTGFVLECGEGNGMRRGRRRGKEKEEVKVSGFLHAPLTGHTTKSLLASPPPVFVSSKQPSPHANGLSQKRGQL